MSRFGDLGGRLYRGEFSFNIVGNKKFWYSVSAGLIVLGDDRVVQQTVISQAKYAPSA